MDKKQLILLIAAGVVTALAKEITTLLFNSVKDLPKGKIKSFISKLLRFEISQILAAIIFIVTSVLHIRKLIKMPTPLTREDAFYISFYCLLTWIWFDNLLFYIKELMISEHKRKFELEMNALKLQAVENPGNNAKQLEK